MRDSYSLKEAAEILGVSPRSLQSRVDEGAFPGRFNTLGRNGLEVHIPVAEVERELERRRRRGLSHLRESAPRAGRPDRARTAVEDSFAPVDVAESLVPYARPELLEAQTSSAPSGITHSDLESMRDATLAIVREDREMFLSVVRDALRTRDREIALLRTELSAMQASVEGVRTSIELVQQRLREATRVREEATAHSDDWAEVVAQQQAAVDVDALLQELADLEHLLRSAG